jgi:hypothetical protein
MPPNRTQIVAHIITIPIALEYRPRKATWKIAHGTVVDWEEGTEEDPAFLVELPHSSTGATVTAKAEYLPGPLAIAYKDTDDAYLAQYHRDAVYVPLDFAQFTEEQRRIPLLSCHFPNGPKRVLANPWLMRDEFIQLKRNDENILDFLKKWGDWGEYLKTGSPEGNSETRFENPDNSANKYLLPSAVWKYQDLFRQALSSPPELWFQSAYSMIWSSPRREYPHHLIDTTDCVRAIRATITFDLLRDLPRGICARPDCSTPFIMDSKHGKRYCRKYCAHLESVRRNRKLKSRSVKKR